jgi:hypothetical protein
MNDLTVIYYTANEISEKFSFSIRKNLAGVVGDSDDLITVSKKSMDYGKNIVVDLPRHHLSIYRQALLGVKAARTKYIALVEDDVLYTAEHFKYRPAPGVFAYNMSVWSIYTWVTPAIFSYKDRRNLSQLICERELFIEAMEERFVKYPDDTKTPIRNWAEPGKYESNLGVTERKSEKFYTDIPNVAFSHETALSYLNLGKRKKLGNLRVTALPHWGTAEEVLALYE